ncbi:MAG: enoyl-CoA hydratase/isomerase family protein [Desulfobacteraceae bacterium]|nr:enoyl-CoA hydratase/isomerase family protein [Desulfobacteraceae bacterium]MBC2754695.1 enoyl-CoA hydratase/isomerase family protein [Desulfobacteraceae bacterium]
MHFIEVSKNEGIATLILCRGKVNALTGEVVDQLKQALSNIEKDPDIRALILTGKGTFFSFGFDVPEFLSYSKDEFSDYLKKFTGLLAYIFLYPKPIVAALNGHTIAGGCMLSLACDQRVMSAGRARISLNEISFGSSVLAGSTEMLRACVGNSNALEILYSGAMYSAEQAQKIGLVDHVAQEQDLVETSKKITAELGEKSSAAFTSIKLLLRKPIAKEFEKKEEDAIKEFVDIWYSKATWENLKKILIK